MCGQSAGSVHKEHVTQIQVVGSRARYQTVLVSRESTPKPMHAAYWLHPTLIYLPAPNADRRATRRDSTSSTLRPPLFCNLKVLTSDVLMLGFQHLVLNFVLLFLNEMR